MGLIYILVTATLVFIFIYNKVFDGNKFIKELSPIFRNIIEDDYEVSRYNSKVAKIHICISLDCPIFIFRPLLYRHRP